MKLLSKYTFINSLSPKAVNHSFSTTAPVTPESSNDPFQGCRTNSLPNVTLTETNDVYFLVLIMKEVSTDLSVN